MTPLTNRQKGYLAQLAMRAYNLRAAIARGARLPFDRTPEQCRHEEVKAAVGKDGLRLCDQADYKTVEGHFLSLLNRDGRAFNAHLAAATESHRLVMHKLTDQLSLMGKSLNYAEGICRNMTRRSLGGLGLANLPHGKPGEKILWSILYALKYQNGEARRGGRNRKHKPDTAPADVTYT